MNRVSSQTPELSDDMRLLRDEELDAVIGGVVADYGAYRLPAVQLTIPWSGLPISLSQFG